MLWVRCIRSYRQQVLLYNLIFRSRAGGRNVLIRLILSLEYCWGGFDVTKRVAVGNVSGQK